MKNKIDREKKTLELKHETVCSDMKNFKAETLKKDKNVLMYSIVLNPI